MSWSRCEGSGNVQMLDWFPDEDYPGAAVCVYCSFGVLIAKGSDHPAFSMTGFRGQAGRLRVHYIKSVWDDFQSRTMHINLTYHKPKELRNA